MDLVQSEPIQEVSYILRESTTNPSHQTNVLKTRVREHSRT